MTERQSLREREMEGDIEIKKRMKRNILDTVTPKHDIMKKRYI